METQKMVVVTTQKMTEAISKYKEANEATRGDYDRRSKANRYARLAEEEANKIIASEILVQALAYIKQVEINLAGVARVTTSGSVSYRDFAPKAYIEIGTRNGFNLAETPADEIKKQIQVAVEKATAEKNKEQARIEVATKMLGLVKDEVTYKNSSWRYDEKHTDKWDGSELESQYKDEKNDWSNGAKIEVRIPSAEKLNVDFRVQMDVKTPEEAKELWDAFQEFVKAKTKFVKKEAN